MRISDWSSDVCSSDLRTHHRRPLAADHVDDVREIPLGAGKIAALGENLRPVGDGIDIGGDAVGRALVLHRVDRLAQHRLGAIAAAGVEPALAEAGDRKSTRLKYRHKCAYRMPSSA